MIVPNISTILLASMGIVSAVNAYSPNFAHVRAALERRQVSTQISQYNNDVQVTKAKKRTTTIDKAEITIMEMPVTVETRLLHC